MNTLVPKPDERIESVHFAKDAVEVHFKDGRRISVPLTWYPKLLKATAKQRSHWELCGGGYGIHWPEIDEDLSSEGLLRGSPAPRTQRVTKQKVSRRRRTRTRIKVKSKVG